MLSEEQQHQVSFAQEMNSCWCLKNLTHSEPREEEDAVFCMKSLSLLLFQVCCGKYRCALAYDSGVLKIIKKYLRLLVCLILRIH